MSRRNASPEANDPTVKLFGRNITLPDSQTPLEFEDSEAPQMAPPISDSMDTSPGAIKMPEEPYNIEDSDNEDENPTPKCLKTTSAEQQNTDDTDKTPEASKAMALRKPDKILPCPRCKSMATKFCYFNNYNVNQPRHFCRSCQRYWTAGGTIRNIPIGAGRRKNKHSSSQLQPVVIPSSEGSFTRVNLINPDSPLCKSVASRLTLEEPGNILEASSTCSSMRDNDVSHNLVKEKMGSSNGFPGPGPPLYPWSFGWNGVAYGGASYNAFLVPWNSPTMAMNPGLCKPNATFPFVPSICWGNLSSNSSLSPASCSGNTSPLGKHSRETNSQDEEKNEKSLWIPKTLRIDDPEEAAKSSIWSTLGIKPGKTELASKGGVFKAFQPRDEKNPERPEADEALKANPAALSRLEAFQESM